MRDYHAGMAKTGRPKLKRGVQKGGQASFRVNAAEKKAIDAAAKAAGLALGTWLRKVALAAAGATP
jgi:uncharacterized protein (DUF1778 family)